MAGSAFESKSPLEPGGDFFILPIFNNESDIWNLALTTLLAS